MKKFYLVFLALVLLFMPTTYGIAVYQLDQPVSQLNGYTLREVFENRNYVMPDLTGKTEISMGVYRLQSQNGGFLDYDISNGHYRIHGLFTGPMNYSFGIRPTGEYFVQIWEVNKVDYANASIVFLGGGSLYSVSLNSNRDYDSKIPLYNSLYRIDAYKDDWSGINNIDVTFKLQLEKGSQATPYQVPTNGPYSDVDITYGWCYFCFCW